MRISIERDGVCTSHETPEITEFVNPERKPGLLFDFGAADVKVGVLGTRDELRSLAKQLFALAGGDVVEQSIERVAPAAAAGKAIPHHSIPKNPLKRAGFLKPVRSARVGKPSSSPARAGRKSAKKKGN
ncbi:MAG: hypothetical protein ACREJD_09505 [Phycisphaerales bacterium]